MLDDTIMDVLYGGAVNVLGAAATVTSIGAVAALKDREHLAVTHKKLETRRKIAYEILHDIPGVRMNMPESGILAWLDISQLGTSAEVASYILSHAHILDK